MPLHHIYSVKVSQLYENDVYLEYSNMGNIRILNKLNIPLSRLTYRKNKKTNTCCKAKSCFNISAWTTGPSLRILDGGVGGCRW